MAERSDILRRLVADPDRWNFVANVMDGALFSLAMSFVSQQTVLPVLVRKIGGGNMAVGLVPVVWLIGFNFPQVLIARRVQREVWKKPLLLQTAVFQRLPWLLLAIISAALFGSADRYVSLALFFLIYALGAVGGSINLPAWFDLIVKLTPVRMRGRLFGARMILGSVFGILGGGTAVFLLAKMPFPQSYAALFALAFAAMMLSYLFLTSLREERPSVPLDAHLQPVSQLPAFLRDHPNYRRFLIADAVLISSTMGVAFYAVHAIQKFHLPDAYAGGFTVIMMVSGILGSIVFGYLADRHGHKVNLQIGAASTSAACVLALTAGGMALYSLVFVCASLTISCSQISRLPFLAEIAPESDRPTMLALANMVTSPFVLWGVVAGWLADAAGYETVFVLAALFALAGFLWISCVVVEPRQAGTRCFCH